MAQQRRGRARTIAGSSAASSAARRRGAARRGAGALKAPSNWELSIVDEQPRSALTSSFSRWRLATDTEQ